MGYKITFEHKWFRKLAAKVRANRFRNRKEFIQVLKEWAKEMYGVTLNSDNEAMGWYDSGIVGWFDYYVLVSKLESKGKSIV